MHAQRLLSCRQAAEQLGYSRRKVLNLIHGGHLPAKNGNPGGRPSWRIRQSDLEAFMQPDETPADEVVRRRRKRRRLDADVEQVV